MNARGIGTKSKLLLLCISVIVIQTVLISFLSYIFLSKETMGIQKVLLDYATVKMQEDLSREFVGYKKLIAEIVIDKNLKTLFSSLESGTDDARAEVITKNTILQKFSEYAQTNSNVCTVVFISSTHDKICYFRKQNNHSTEDQHLWDEYAGIMTDYEGKDHSSINITIKKDGKHNYHLVLMYPAIDMTSKERFGTILLEVDMSDLDLLSNLTSSNTALNSFIMPISSISDMEGTIISTTNPNDIGKNIIEYSYSDNPIIKQIKIEHTDFMLNLVFDKQVFWSNLQEFSTLMIMINLILVLGFTVVIYFTISRSKTNAQKIATAISEFRTNKEKANIELDYRDEVLSVVADQFNLMSSEIETLLLTLHEKNEHIIMVKDQQRNSEIKALQAQINPHFIYNALDRINWEAINNKQHNISTMLSELASLMRYSISNINILVPLSVELEWMEKYFHVQGERFGNPIKLNRNVSPEALDFPIYKMLLQPIVENSIVHGFSMGVENPVISITAKLIDEETLYMVLGDNGKGMNRETLKEVEQILENHGAQNKDSIGVGNVASRIWYCYGEKSSISLSSKENEGTEFFITIPLRRNP